MARDYPRDILRIRLSTESLLTPQLLDDDSKFLCWSKAERSICIQEGEPCNKAIRHYSSRLGLAALSSQCLSVTSDSVSRPARIIWCQLFSLSRTIRLSAWSLPKSLSP